jgi:predicted membrane-bound spermidine synthase
LIEGLPSSTPGARERLLLSVIVLWSGATALLFETLWFRLVGLALGNSVATASLVLTSFMAGMAAGSALAARIGDRVSRPLRAYAALELLIGASAASLVLALPASAPLLAPLLQPLLGTPALGLVRLSVSGLLLFLPSVGMGATLPLLVRAFSAGGRRFGASLGWLYGWNTLGAMAGALCETPLVGALGIRGAGLAGVALSLATAALAFRLSGRFVAPALPAEAAAPLRASVRFLASTFLCGAILLALEVAWFRLLLLYVHGTSVAFAVLLALVLGGIAAGGLLGSWWLGRDPAAHRWLRPLALLAGAAGVACYAGFDPAGWYGRQLVGELWMIAALAAPLMLPGAALSGLLFTLLGAGLEARLGLQARAVGALTFANTLGAALGGAVSSWLLLPGLGMERTFFLLSAAYVGVALLAPPPDRPSERRLLWLGLAAQAALLALYPFGLMAGRHLKAIRERFGGAQVRIEAVREARAETLVYLRRELWGEPHFHQLVTNGLSMSASPLSAKRYMKQYVYWPLAVNPRIRRALLICYGVGSTAKALSDARQLERIDVVEISSEVLELGGIPHAGEGGNPLRDARVRQHVEDGRFFLQVGGESYDLITGEPPPPKSAGVVSLYTQEYFQLIHDRLTAGGVVSYWLPVDQLSRAETLAIVRGFCNVFRECSLWTGTAQAWMLAGTRGALGPVSEEDFTAQWRDERVAPELARTGFDTPELLGTTFLADAQQLAQLAGQQPPLLDDRPGRLSPFAPAGLDPLYAGLMDVVGARERFAGSAYIRRVWPAALRERTLRQFELQDVLNRRFLEPAFGLRYEDAALLLLRRERPRALTLWVLDSDDDEQRLAARARARGVSDGLLEYKLGVGALAGGEATRAAGHFARARALAPGQRFLDDYRALALCLAGDREAAVAQAVTPAFREWLAATKGRCE